MDIDMLSGPLIDPSTYQSRLYSLNSQAKSKDTCVINEIFNLIDYLI